MIQFFIVGIIITCLRYRLDLVMFLREQSIIIACLQIYQPQILTETRMYQICGIFKVLSYFRRIHWDSINIPSIFQILSLSYSTIIVIVLYCDNVYVNLRLIIDNWLWSSTYVMMMVMNMYQLFVLIRRANLVSISRIGRKV